MQNGIPRSKKLIFDAQEQTKTSFSYKWKKVESEFSLQRMKKWLLERYDNAPNSKWFKEHGLKPLLFDFGCGAGMKAIKNKYGK